MQSAAVGELTRYDDNEILLKRISDLIKSAIPGSLETSTESKAARKDADKRYREALEAVQTGIQKSLQSAAGKVGKEYTDTVTFALTSLDAIRKNIASRTPETDSLFQPGSSETVKLVESLRSLASSIATDNEKLDQELSVVASGSLIPTYKQILATTPLPIDFDLSGLLKLVTLYAPSQLGEVALSFGTCEPKNDTPPICKPNSSANPPKGSGYQCKTEEVSVASPAADGGGGGNAPTRSKFYGLYYRIPAVCPMTVSVSDQKYPLHNVELMQVGRLARLQLKNGPFQDSIQSVSFDENGSVAEYKQQVRSSATGSAVTSTADAIDTISQTKQKKIDSRTKELKAEKDLADAQKDLYESQKKRDDALDALKKN